MGAIRITGPDGRVARITPPEGATQEQIDAKIAEVKANWNVSTEPKTSFLGSAARGLGQAAFGLGDEIEAGIRAAVDPNKTYSDIIPEVRQNLAQSQEEFPITTYGAEIAGSIAMPLGLAAKGVGLAANAAGKGLGAAVKAGAKEGALYGAAYGAGKSEGGLENRAEGALGGAAVGGAIGGAAPAVVAGGGAIADSIRSNVNKIRNPLDEATREVARAAKASDESANLMRAMGREPLRIDSNPAAVNLANRGQAGQDIMLVDTMGESGRRLLRSATNNSPEAREMSEAALMQRSEGQTSRALDFIRGLTGRAGNAGQSADDLERWRKLSADPVYKAARAAGDRPLWSRNLEQLTGSGVVRDAMQKAAKTVNDRSISEGYGAMNVGVSFENGVMRFTKGANGQTAYPNLAFWDETKRNLDAIVKKAARDGDNNVASIGTKTLNTLRDELDQMVPEYKDARGIAANYFKADNALEAGQKFASGKHDFHAVEKMLANPKITPMEKSMFQEGFVAKYLDDVGDTRDRRDLTKILMSDVNARRAFEVALGKSKARQLEAFLHIEKVMEASKGALGNSTTAQQLKDMGAAGLITGSAGGMLQGGYFDPTAAVMGAIGKYGIGKAKSNIDNKFAQHIAAILTSKDPKQVNLAMQQLSTPDNLATLRRISAGITGAGAAVGGSMSATGDQQ
jgi:hypothetical protein